LKNFFEVDEMLVENFLILLGQCANVVVPEATEEAMRYYTSGNWLWILDHIWQFGLFFLFLIMGWSGKMGSLAGRWGKRWFFALAIYLILFLTLFDLLNLPLDFYTGYIRQHEYGLSFQTPGRWWNQHLKEFLVSLVMTLSFVWIFYLLLKKSPRRWWFYGAIVSSIISFFLIFIQPIWVAPLFNHFGPMKDKALEEKILKLAHRAGISNGSIFEVDKSSDTKAVNAYVTGLGATSRIVLWDTAIQNLKQDQLLFVMGHEMGHYVLHHVWWSFLYYSFLSFFIFYLTYKIGTYIVHRYSEKLKFSHLSSPASLPLLFLIVSTLTFISSPLSLFISRQMEHQADCFGLEITQNNRAAGEGFLVLQRENLANPNPGFLYRMWRSSHPPLKERVDFFNSYCPWKEGKPLKYGKYFKEE
jgi:STE24 endopeptidase